MPITVLCPSCSAKLNAPDAAAGKKVKCPRCQSLMVVPQPAAEPLDFEVVEEESPRPSAPAAAAQPKRPTRVKADVYVDDDDERPRKRSRVAEDDSDDEDDDRPRKKKKKPAADNTMLIRNIVGGVVLVVLLGIAGYIFYDRFQKSKENTASNKPTEDDGGGAKVINPRIVGPGGDKLQPKDPPIPGGGNPLPIDPGPGKGPPTEPPGGTPGKGKFIGTPGQPITLTAPAGFKITFPGPYAKEPPPASFTKKVPHPTDAYLSLDQKNFHLYLAVVVKLPATLTAEQRQQAYNDIVAAMSEPDEPDDKVQIVARRKVESGGHTWDELKLAGASKKIESMTVTMRVMQANQQVYIIAASSLLGEVDPKASQQYFGSFELTK
jgi:hypothetical protein